MILSVVVAVGIVMVMIVSVVAVVILIAVKDIKLPSIRQQSSPNH